MNHIVQSRQTLRARVEIYFAAIPSGWRETHVVYLFATEIGGNRVRSDPAMYRRFKSSVRPIRQPRANHKQIDIGRSGRI